MVPSFNFLSFTRLRPSSVISYLLFASAVFMGPLLLGACGQPSSDPGAHDVEPGRSVGHTSEAPTTTSPVDARSEMEAALTKSLSGPAGSLQRHTSAGLDGISVVIITDLKWRDGSGHMSKEFVVDEQYLLDPQVRELVESTNRDLQSENRDLVGNALDNILYGARETMSQLLDDVELKPLGLGWWEGTTGGAIDTQTLEVFISGGRLQKISRSVEVVGSTGSDTWEFTS